MDIVTDAINLSLCNAETGIPLTANIYKVTLDNGNERVMSIGQLVMALCLSRATEQENTVVTLMDDMAETTNWINALSDVEEKILETVGDATNATVNLNKIEGSWSITKSGETEPTTCSTAAELLAAMGVTFDDDTKVLSDTAISSIETKLDQCNTTSQEQMISLQSATNKRDQAYEMISNVLKSLYNVMAGIVNNT